MPPDLVIRDVEPRDYEWLVDTYNEWHSEPMSLNEFVSRETRQLTGGVKRRWVGELADGTPVGTGHARRMQQFSPGMYLTTVVVRLEQRSQGFGRALQRHLEGWIRDEAGSWMVTLLRDTSERDLRIATQSGFSFLQHLFESKVDLNGFDASEFDQTLASVACQSIEIKRYSDLVDDAQTRASLHHAYSTSDLDTPGIETWGVSDHSHFEEEFFCADWFNPDYVTVALSGEKIVGVSVIAPTEKGQWFTDYTGVLPEFRGKGLALAMKVRGLEAAKAAGAKTVRTNNDANNAPMLAVNRKLGFVPEPGWLYLRKTLGPTG